MVIQSKVIQSKVIQSKVIQSKVFQLFKLNEFSLVKDPLKSMIRLAASLMVGSIFISGISGSIDNAEARRSQGKEGLKDAASSLPEGQEIHIGTPIRGWRTSAGEKSQYLQEVNYPASVVNIEGFKSESEMIRGRLRAAPKKGPITLIVNGLDMPMKIDGLDFARPFAFNAGSNSVEVRAHTDRGHIQHRVQFYEAHSTMTSPKIRVLLAWDSDGTDLDLHVVTPDGQHCWYGNRNLPNGGALDIDVTTGYGPEIFSTPSPIPGTYLVFVNYYGSGSRDDLTTVKVTIMTHVGTPDEKLETVVAPMRAPGELTLIKSFQYP